MTPLAKFELNQCDEDIRQAFTPKEYPISADITCNSVLQSQSWLLGTPTNMQLVRELRGIRGLLEKAQYRQQSKEAMNATVQDLITELESAIVELHETALGGIDYVGSANYIERQQEACHDIYKCKEKVDVVMAKLMKALVSNS